MTSSLTFMPQTDMTSVLLSGAKASMMRPAEGFVKKMSKVKVAEDPSSMDVGPVKLKVGTAKDVG
jgi:hypothetical protein